MGDPNMVFTGPGLLYVAPLGTAEPTDSTTALPGAWAPIGFTTDGSVFTSTTTWNGIYVEEALNAARWEPNQTVETVAFGMAENTKRNLALALNKGAAVANDAVAIEPSLPTAYLPVMLIHQGASGARSLFRRCRQTGSIVLTNKKSPDKRIIPVVFTLEDASPLMPWKIWPASAPLAVLGAV